jgi:hypothetical protein
MVRIACPKCDYRPAPDVLWQCHPGCGHRWHTFSTHGICPQCSKFWHDTQCPHCRMWSLHDEWYREDVSSRTTSLEKSQEQLEKEYTEPYV